MQERKSGSLQRWRRLGGAWGGGKGLCVEAAAVDSRKFYKCGDEIRSRTQNCGDIRREHSGSRKHEGQRNDIS